VEEAVLSNAQFVVYKHSSTVKQSVFEDAALCNVRLFVFIASLAVQGSIFEKAELSNFFFQICHDSFSVWLEVLNKSNV
jgi:hypothetical protein